MLREISVFNKAVTPQLIIYVLFLDRLFRILNENEQDLVSLMSKRDRLAVFLQFLSFYIKAEIVEHIGDGFAHRQFEYVRSIRYQSNPLRCIQIEFCCCS